MFNSKLESSAINGLLIKNEIKVREIKVETSNLEDYFLNNKGGALID